MKRNAMNAAPIPVPISRLSVLACYAHPDDEGFASGGLLAMLAAGGARVTLVCATNGDVGEISDPALATPENLWQVRQQELRNAMEIAGVSDLRFLNYRDSGMDGADDNRHPNAYCNSDADAVIARIAGIIAETSPQIVLTHDPTGGYGTPTTKRCRLTPPPPCPAPPLPTRTAPRLCSTMSASPAMCSAAGGGR